MTERTVQEKIVGASNPVNIAGREISPKRLKVREVNELIAEKMNRTKQAQAAQIKLTKIQIAIETQDFSSLGMDENNIDAEVEKLQSLLSEMVIDATGTHNLWLVEKCYDLTEDDVDNMEYEEYERAVEAIFEVNPSLGKSRQLLTMNPFQTNPNG